MKRSKLLGAILSSLLVASVAITIVPALAYNRSHSSTLKQAGFSGYVLLQLPSPATPSHPYYLRLLVQHFDKLSLQGEEDAIGIYVWSPNYPGASRFVWIGAIRDNQAGIDFMKLLYTGFVAADNQIKVDDNELEITKKGDVLTVNLTKPVKFEIGDPWPQHLKDLNFTFPAMTLEFRGLDETKKTENAPATLAPPASGAGWINQVTTWDQPAWVETRIPAWYGSTLIHTDGVLTKKVDIAWTPPPTT